MYRITFGITARDTEEAMGKVFAALMEGGIHPTFVHIDEED